jgi:hypothetical protein
MRIVCAEHVSSAPPLLLLVDVSNAFNLYK